MPKNDRELFFDTARRLVEAVLAALVLRFAFPGFSLWPLAFIGIALLLHALRGTRTLLALHIGFVTGAIFFGTLVSWTSTFLGPVPWIALTVFLGVGYAVGCALIAAAYRLIPVLTRRPRRRALLVAAVVAGLWGLREQVAGTFPYGGFAWGRIAESQWNSPLAHIVSWLGFPGVSFACVFAVALSLELALPRTSALAKAQPFEFADARVQQPRVADRVMLGAAACAFLLAIPPFAPVTTGHARIAGVQSGSEKAGYFLAGQPGDVLDAQVEASERIRGPKPDLVVWPEGSVDVPIDSDYAKSSIEAASMAADGAPVIANGVRVRRGEYFNESFVTEASGRRGAVSDKAHPVPFGEYIPDRWFYRMLAPALVDLVQRGYSPGTLDPVISVGGMKAAVAICFDIIDDRLAAEWALHGGEVIIAQTNNADFGRSDETRQQMAITSLRAQETGRAIVSVSTVGESAILLPDGTSEAAGPTYRAYTFSRSVPLSTTVTPAVLVGNFFGWTSALAALIVLAAVWWEGRRLRRAGRRRRRAPRPRSMATHSL